MIKAGDFLHSDGQFLQARSHLLCTFISLFSIVNAHDDLFVRSSSYISSTNREMAVCLHVKL